MNCDASVLSVCWDADSLFRLASTKLPEERSATQTIVRLSALGFVKSITSKDAVEDAEKGLLREFGGQSDKVIHELHELLRAYFCVILTPAPEKVQACLSEVLDDSDAFILAAARETNCSVLITYNTRHFTRAKRINVLTPKEFVEQVRKALWCCFQPPP
ncbi:MAG: PIN domain-containing protein [Armatimonadota bacterium]